jgi:protein-tyrosine phosphatase
LWEASAEIAMILWANQMIDIHHHLLYGLDDGPPDLETSVAMAKMAVEDGITHIVCTPHASGMFGYDPARNAEHLASLRDALAAEAVPLTLGMGCDFHLSYDNIQEALAQPTKFSINGSAYLLVELPDFGLPRTLTDTFYQMQLAGMTPILTHPERNPTLQRDTGRLIDWLRNGLLVQVTTSSVVGQMGKEAEQMSHRLLSDRWVHFLATDAHNLTTRPPKMKAAYDLVAKRYGATYADLLCIDNPRAVFNGEPLGPQDEPRNLFQDNEEKKSWWKRLLRR